MAKTPIQEIRELLEIQGNADPYHEDDYMRGMYNGLELALSVLENREPVYRHKPAQTATQVLEQRQRSSDFMRRRLEPVSYGMDVGAAGDESYVAFVHPNWLDELRNPPTKTMEDPFGEYGFVPISDYFKDQLRDEDMVVGTIDSGFRFIQSPLPASTDITCTVAEYMAPPPSPEILRLIEDCKERIDKECGLPPKYIGDGGAYTGHWSTGRRAGKTSMLEAMQRALLDNLAGDAVIRTPEPVLAQASNLASLRHEMLAMGVLRVHTPGDPACELWEDDDVGEPEPAGDREMDIVRSMCKGTR